MNDNFINENNEFNNNRPKSMNKAIIVPTVIAIVMLLVLTLGATYAYISVTTSNNFGTPTIQGKVPSIGSVTMNAGTSLTLTTTRQGMMDENAKAYYASPSGISESNAMQTVATAIVSGEGTFTCTYTLNIKGDGDLLKKSKSLGPNLVTLEVTYGNYGTSTVTYDFNNDLTTAGNILSNSGASLNGTFTGLTQGHGGTIQARFKLENSATANQTTLNGTSGTITFSVSSFACTATA